MHQLLESQEIQLQTQLPHLRRLCSNLLRVLEKMADDLNLEDFQALDDILDLEEEKTDGRNESLDPLSDAHFDEFEFSPGFDSDELNELEMALKIMVEEGSKSQAIDDLLSCKKHPDNDVAAAYDPPKEQEEAGLETEKPKSEETGNAGIATQNLAGSSSGLLAGQVTDAEKKRKKWNTKSKTGPEPPPGLPESFRERIESLGGRDPVLVSQKNLTETDLQKCQSRLSIPKSSLRNEFLTDEEKAFLDTSGNKIDTLFLDTKGKQWTVPLRNHERQRDHGKPAKYVLTAPWNSLALDENKLVAKDLVQLWGFRVEEKLCLALVRLDKDE